MSSPSELSALFTRLRDRTVATAHPRDITETLLAIIDGEIRPVSAFPSANLGVKSSGTVALSPAAGRFQSYTNGGAHTLSPPVPEAGTAVEIILDIVNGASAGVVTVSGFTKIVGAAAFATTAGLKFRCRVTVSTGGSLLEITPLQ